MDTAVTTIVDFNPHSRVGSDAAPSSDHGAVPVFQSTLPRRE